MRFLWIFPSSKFIVYASLHRFIVDMDAMPTKTEVTEEECIRIAKEMIMMRRMEIESDPLYVMRKIRGFLHLYDGEVGMDARS